MHVYILLHFVERRAGPIVIQSARFLSTNSPPIVHVYACTCHAASLSVSILKATAPYHTLRMMKNEDMQVVANHEETSDDE